MTKELKALREYRNNLLDKSDWTQTNDSPLSDSKKEEWKTYRQALRDITKDAKPKLENSWLDITSVKFPTEPS